MKWTKEKESALRNLCLAGIPNSEIASTLGCNVKDIYAKRSQMGITIDECKARKKYVYELPDEECVVEFYPGSQHVEAKAVKVKKETKTPAEPKFCPWMRMSCKEQQCALWIKYVTPEDSCCALVALVDSLV